MIPPFDPVTGNLPPGEHAATWQDVEETLGWNVRRKELIAGIRRALLALASAGCTRAWIDGSFATDTDSPGDFDMCWDYRGVDTRKLAVDYPVFFDFVNGRRAQKATYGGEMFLSTQPADQAGRVFLDFFQTDRDTGERKGIIVVNPGEVT